MGAADSGLQFLQQSITLPNGITTKVHRLSTLLAIELETHRWARSEAKVQVTGRDVENALGLDKDVPPPALFRRNSNSEKAERPHFRRQDVVGQLGCPEHDRHFDQIAGHLTYLEDTAAAQEQSFFCAKLGDHGVFHRRLLPEDDVLTLMHPQERRSESKTQCDRCTMCHRKPVPPAPVCGQGRIEATEHDHSHAQAQETNFRTVKTVGQCRQEAEEPIRDGHGIIIDDKPEAGKLGHRLDHFQGALLALQLAPELLCVEMEVPAPGAQQLLIFQSPARRLLLIAFFRSYSIPASGEVLESLRAGQVLRVVQRRAGLVVQAWVDHGAAPECTSEATPSQNRGRCAPLPPRSAARVEHVWRRDLYVWMRALAPLWEGAEGDFSERYGLW
jgi:hypothetical protein